MANELIVDVAGTAVSVRAPETLLRELGEVLADLEPGADPSRCLVVEEGPDGDFRLLDAGTVVVAGVAASVAAATVVWRLNEIAADTRRHLVIHAGCVASAGAVLLPGRSGAGKSTLVSSCVTAGMSYLSDEFAVVDLDDGSIVPYAKPIALDGERLVTASRLRAGSAGARSAPGGIVFPCFTPGAPTTLTVLERSWTLVALAAHATNLSAVGDRALPWLAGIAASCPAWQVTYGASIDVVPTVREAAGRRVAPVRPAEVIGPVTPTTTTVVMGDDLAVFDGPTGRIHVLNAGAAFVWTCVPDAADASGLTEVALARAPAGSLDRRSVDATVDHLAGAGLLPDRMSVSRE